MMEYDILIRTLRDQAERFYYDGWVDTSVWFQQAAYAIEELVATVERIQYLHINGHEPPKEDEA